MAVYEISFATTLDESDPIFSQCVTSRNGEDISSKFTSQFSTTETEQYEDGSCSEEHLRWEKFSLTIDEELTVTFPFEENDDELNVPYGTKFSVRTKYADVKVIKVTHDNREVYHEEVAFRDLPFNILRYFGDLSYTGYLEFEHGVFAMSLIVSKDGIRYWRTLVVDLTKRTFHLGTSERSGKPKKIQDDELKAVFAQLETSLLTCLPESIETPERAKQYLKEAFEYFL